MYLAILKIKNILDRYINSVKDVKLPDVHELYKTFGEEVMGRKIVTFEDANKDTEYFNKAVIHKSKKGYIGKPRKEFYPQTIINTKSEYYIEFRTLVINSIGDNSNEENVELVNMIIDRFKIKDFTMDCFTYNEGNGKYIHEIGRNGIMLMEVNEIHLSTIDKKQLDFVYERLL